MARFPRGPQTQDAPLYPEPPIYGEVPAPPYKAPGTEDAPTPGQTAPGADPWDTPPADGDWQAWFMRNVEATGLTPNSASLKSIEAKLAKHGIKVIGNAANTIFDSLQLPDGQMVDVGRAFSSGDQNQMGWAWQIGEGGAAAGGANGNAAMADWFASNAPSMDPYTTLARPDYLKGPYTPDNFVAPTYADLESDPGYQARLAAGQQALERSAAAKGSILSGGFVGRTMPRELGKLASEEFGNLYQRRLGTFGANAAVNYGARQFNEGAYQSDVGNAYNQYQQRFQAYRSAIGDKFRIADMGLNATLGGRP